MPMSFAYLAQHTAMIDLSQIMRVSFIEGRTRQETKPRSVLAILRGAKKEHYPVVVQWPGIELETAHGTRRTYTYKYDDSDEADMAEFRRARREAKTDYDQLRRHWVQGIPGVAHLDGGKDVVPSGPQPPAETIEAQAEKVP